jgi:apolipoprotein N-acyltransferase
MKLCGECRKKPWPYVLVVFISTFVAFVTWLTLSAAGLAPEANRWWTALAFLIAGGVLFIYMMSCMRRHCADDGHAR